MLPDQPGTYVLVLRLARSATIAVGRLGQFSFQPGWYAYVGSARGPGGLAARVARHLRGARPVRWHVDYLRRQATPVAVWHVVGTESRECAWAQVLVGLPGATVPAPRFGASDCRCPTHLVFFGRSPDVQAFAQAAGEPTIDQWYAAQTGER